MVSSGKFNSRYPCNHKCDWPTYIMCQQSAELIKTVHRTNGTIHEYSVTCPTGQGLIFTMSQLIVINILHSFKGWSCWTVYFTAMTLGRPLKRQMIMKLVCFDCNAFNIHQHYLLHTSWACVCPPSWFWWTRPPCQPVLDRVWQCDSYEAREQTYLDG